MNAYRLLLGLDSGQEIVIVVAASVEEAQEVARQSYRPDQVTFTHTTVYPLEPMRIAVDYPYTGRQEVSVLGATVGDHVILHWPETGHNYARPLGKEWDHCLRFDVLPLLQPTQKTCPHAFSVGPLMRLDSP
jgi:hypothetical protein